MAGAPNTNELFITGGFSANIKKTIVYQNMKVGNFIEKYSINTLKIFLKENIILKVI